MPSPKPSRAEPRPKLRRSQTQNPRPRLKPRPRLQPEAKVEAKPEAEQKPPASAGVAALLNTSLGDLLVAGLVKDPEDAGRIIAAAITQAEARVAAPKAPETDAEPAEKSEPQPDGKAKTPTDVIPQTVK